MVGGWELQRQSIPSSNHAIVNISTGPLSRRDQQFSKSSHSFVQQNFSSHFLVPSHDYSMIHPRILRTLIATMVEDFQKNSSTHVLSDTPARKHARQFFPATATALLTASNFSVNTNPTNLLTRRSWLTIS
jgi:hypothetical protein